MLTLIKLSIWEQPNEQYTIERTTSHKVTYTLREMKLGVDYIICLRTIDSNNNKSCAETLTTKDRPSGLIVH
jgi:hypothetical protein